MTIVPAGSPVGSDTSRRTIGIDHSVASARANIFLSRSESLVPLANCALTPENDACGAQPASRKAADTAATIAEIRNFILRPVPFDLNRRPWMVAFTRYSVVRPPQFRLENRRRRTWFPSVTLMPRFAEAPACPSPPAAVRLGRLPPRLDRAA